jgi:hypothetical protein
MRWLLYQNNAAERAQFVATNVVTVLSSADVPAHHRAPSTLESPDLPP